MITRSDSHCEAHMSLLVDIVTCMSHNDRMNARFAFSIPKTRLSAAVAQNDADAAFACSKHIVGFFSSYKLSYSIGKSC